MRISIRDIFSLTALTPLCAGALITADAYAVADPSTLTTVSGDISHSITSPGNLHSQQNSGKAIISGPNVDVHVNESWTIAQPSSQSALLVRVNGGQPTQIMGKLSANGKVMLINGSGVMFGQSAEVNVGSLVASSADISDANFNAGNYVFDRPGNADAAIVNKGKITAADGGLVALVAPGVKNDGLIVANAGQVQLASGDAFTVDFYGDGLYSFEVTQASTQAGKDANGNVLSAGVENTGQIMAQAGRVVMTAANAKGIVDHAVNNTGIVEATSLHEVNGEIILDGGNGAVNVAGTLNASGNGAGESGGIIDVRSTDTITVANNAQLNASGDVKGGKINVGGPKRGQGAAPKAQTVLVSADSHLDASAQSGDAGEVVVWSDERTEFAGTIDVSSQQGKGGFAEVSSAESLTYSGHTDARGTEFGTLLLDPGNWEITDDATTANKKNATELESQLASSNVVIDTSTAANQPGNLGDITVNAEVSWNGKGALTLNAANDIIINALMNSRIRTSEGQSGALTFNAGNDIFVNHTSVRSASGDLNFNSDNVSLNGALIRSLLGEVNFNNTGVFSNNRIGNVSGKTVNINQNIGGSIQTAINSVAFENARTTITVGNGIFNENLVLPFNRITLQSQNGRNATTITGVNGVGKDATVSIAVGATGMQIGGENKGLTILALDNGNAVNLNGGNDRTALLDNRFVIESGETGLRVADSADVTSADNDFNGAGRAVFLTGAGTDFAFADNLNSFNSSALYFELDGGAMNGDTLDASQQTFDGVRAANFTQTQYDNARNRTIDSDTRAGVGYVFYRNFTGGPTPPVTPPPTIVPTGGLVQDTLNLLIVRERGPLRNVFSYSGQTVESTPQLTNYNFIVQNLNLSLLAPSAGNPPAPAATNFANLSPAAGGQNYENMGGPYIPATGNYAERLANLSPAAGGNVQAGAEEQQALAGFNCVNNFLSSGFNDGSCTNAQ